MQVNGRISALLELGAGFNMEYSGLENVYLNGTMIIFTQEEIDKNWMTYWLLLILEISYISR